MNITQLEKIIYQWQFENLKDFDQISKETKIHFNDEELYELATENFIKNADIESMEHLTKCSICMKKWIAWKEAISLSKQSGGEIERVLCCGFLEAAASKGPVEAITSKSSCGKFILGVYPKKDSTEHVLVTLEYVDGDPSEMEGRKFSVRDTKSNLVIEGVLRNGRMARVLENFTEIDLAKWSLVENNTNLY